MRWKNRMMAGVMALVIGTGAFSVPVLANAGTEEQQSAEESVTSTDAKEKKTESKKDVVIDRDQADAQNDKTEEKNDAETIEELLLNRLLLSGIDIQDVDLKKLLVHLLENDELSLILRDGEHTEKKVGTVTTESDPLNVRDGAGKGNKIIHQLSAGAKVEVLDKEGEWYKVSVPEQIGYVYKDYLKVDTEVNDDGEYEFTLDAEMLMKLLSLFMSEETTATEGLTPSGNLTLVDDYGTKSGAGQQFITLVTKNGNYFYMVIDRDDKGQENVHFLNMVDEADLFALMDEKQVADFQTQMGTQQPVETKPEVTETTEETKEEPEVVETKKKTNWVSLILLLLVMVGGGVFFLYFSINKKKMTAEATRPDPDADYEDEEEEYILLEEEDEEIVVDAEEDEQE